MKRRMNTNSVKYNKFVLIAVLLFFVVIIYRMSVLSLSKTIDGVDVQAFASARNSNKEVIYAKRGTVYDSESNVLAQTINSYTVVAYLSNTRGNGNYVNDKEDTALKLSEIINMEYETILALLTRNAYQVELGPGGRGITELTKEKIVELNLPGIGFIPSYKRYYPNGNFASYVLGYVQIRDSGEMVGELGVELAYNNQLKGTDGSYEYQQDLYGYKMANTTEIVVNAQDGVDIYLTIDSNIQFFLERTAAEVYEQYNPEWLIAVVADAKTGAILGSTSYPSFDPNIKNITNYLNPLVSFAYEPGSIMKTFTYMAVMEKGVYDGDATFTSGSIAYGGDVISDYDPKGWGVLTYDQGYTKSANTGASNLTKSYINGVELKAYYEKLGFGSKTGIELLNESTGALGFYYPFEVANAAFGQGITTTPIQQIQALTTISNNGMLLKPYIVEKVVDSNNGNIIYYGGKEELGQVASTETIEKMKELMYQVVNGDSAYSTGTGYKQTGLDIMAKTGTAQYINPKTGRYYYGDSNYIRSFSGIFPKDNPQYIVFVSIKRPTSSTSLYRMVNPLIKDIANYKGIYADSSKNEEIIEFTMPNLLNKTPTYVNSYFENLTKKVYIIGDGTKVISQYPSSGDSIDSLERIFVITDSEDYQIPNIKNWSLKEITTLCKLLNITLKYEGTGYIYSYDTSGLSNNNKRLSVKLKNNIE